MGETHILREVSPFLFNSFHILRLQKQSFSRIFERYATLPMVIFRAWATCGVDLPAQVDLTRINLVPRALFPGFPSKAREKRPGDEVAPGK